MVFVKMKNATAHSILQRVHCAPLFFLKNVDSAIILVKIDVESAKMCVAIAVLDVRGIRDPANLRNPGGGTPPRNVNFVKFKSATIVETMLFTATVRGGVRAAIIVIITCVRVLNVFAMKII